MDKYCILMLVSSIVLITNFKNVFALVKFHYKMPFVSSDEHLVEIAGHFLSVFLGATVTSLATTKARHQ